MENIVNVFANITQQVDQMVAAGQVLIDGISAALSMLAQLTDLANQAINFLASF